MNDTFPGQNPESSPLGAPCSALPSAGVQRRTAGASAPAAARGAPGWESRSAGPGEWGEEEGEEEVEEGGEEKAGEEGEEERGEG